MQRVPDPYRVLGLGRDATAAEIKGAHRRLAKRLHPDAPGADEQAFLAVQGAYELLKDPLRRRDWDRRHAPGPVRADEPAAQRPSARPRPVRKAPEPGRWTWSAAGVPWWEDGGSPGTKRPPGRKRPGGTKAPHADATTQAPAGPSAGAPPKAADADIYSRSSGAAWSSAARAYFRRASADMPSGAANPDTPRWTTPLGTAPSPRYETPPRRAAAGGDRGQPPPTRSEPVVFDITARRGWPTLVQRVESGLVAAVPLVLVAGFGAFGRFGTRAAEIAILVALVAAWAGFCALPRAAWVAARGTVGGLLGLVLFVLLGFLMRAQTAVFTSFMLAVMSIGAGYAVGVVLALRDAPVRRPWLRPPGSPE